MLRPNHRSPVIVPVHRGGPVVAVRAAGADPGVALSVPRGNFWRKLLVSISSSNQGKDECRTNLVNAVYASYT